MSNGSTGGTGRPAPDIWEAGITHDRERDPTGEGGELASECLAGLQAAFEAHFGAETPPICSGCSPIAPFEGGASSTGEGG